MAERTQAEMLADLERALARQDADRELFERQEPVGREFAYGIPGVQEEGTLPTQLLSYLAPFRTEVLQPPVTEFGEPRTQLNPVTNQLEQVADRTITPGVYGESKFGLQYTPIARGIGSMIDYGQRLIDSPEARSQAADAISRFPEQMKRQLVGGAESLERGRLQTVDPKTGQEFSAAEALLAAPVPLAAARAIAGAPEGTTLGVLGGTQGVETSKTLAQYQDRVMNNLEPRQVVEKELEVGIGADGLPRAYMGDFEVKQDAYNEAVRQPGQKTKLEDLVEAPEYFRNYPDMARVEVDVENASTSGTRLEVLPLSVAERRGESIEDFDVSDDLNFYDGPTNTVYLAGSGPAKGNLRAAMQSFVSQKEGFAEPKLLRETAEIVAPLALPVNTINQAQTNFSALFSSRNFFEPITDPQGIVANKFTDDIFTPSIEGGPNYEGVAGQTSPRKRTKNLKDLLPLNFYQLRRALGTDAGMPGESGGDFDTLMDQDIYNNQMREKYKDGTAGRFLSEKLGEVIETLPRPLSQRGIFGLVSESTPQSDAVTTLQELQQKLAAVPPSLFTTLYENAMQQAPRIAAADSVLAKQPDRYNKRKARFDIGATDRLASEERAKQLASLQDERVQLGQARAREQQTIQELLQPAIDDAIVADTQMFRQNVGLNEPGGLLPVGFAEARNANLKNFGIPDTAQNIGLYDTFSPFTSQTRRALDFVQRTQGKPEQYIADLKKAVEKQGLGIRPRDLDASGLLQALQQTAQKQGGKLTKDDVGLLLTNIDRPPQFMKYSGRSAPYEGTSLPGDTRRQEMWLLHSPPRADDSLAFAESHVSGAGRNNFVAISELENLEVDVPNVLVHLRGKPHASNLEDKEVFVVEELQSELKDRETKIAAEQSIKHGGSIQNQYNPLTVPERYLKSYETALERMLVESARNERDFAVVSGAQSNVVQKNLGRDYRTEYDQEIPKIMKRLAKKYGLEYKDIEIELSDRNGNPTSKLQLIDEKLGVDNGEAYFRKLGAEERIDEIDGRPIVVMKVKGFELPLEKRREILSKGVPFFALGGEVNQMRKPVISSGLSGLLRGYTQGPLARVSRETQEPVGMRRGGMMGGEPQFDFNQLPVGIAAPQQILPAYTVPAQAAEQLAAQALFDYTNIDPVIPNIPAGMTVVPNVSAGMTAGGSGQSGYEGYTGGSTGSTLIENYQNRGGTRDDSIGDSADAPADPVAADPVATTPVATTPVATTPVATTPVAAAPVETTPAAVAEAPVAVPVATVPADPVYLPPAEVAPVVAGPSAAEILAAEQAAADVLAAQEAEQIRIAEEEAVRVAAEQEAIRIANEQAAADLLAQQEAARIAQEQAAAEEAQRLASELLAAQEAEKALIAEQLAAEQLAAEQLAAQQAAQLVADQEAAAQLQAAEQLAAQQAADRVAMEAQIAATPDPDPIYEAPTQGELLQAAETAQAAEAPLFTTPTETDMAIDRGAYARPTGLGLAGIQTLLNRVNLDVADSISPYTTGFPTTQGMDIQRTYMPFEGTEEERATGYTMPVYKPVAQQAVPSLFDTTDYSDMDTDAFTAGSAAPDSNSGIINTGTQSTAPGAYGLEATQMYRCGNGYTLQFVNGNPVCVRTGGGGPGKPPRKDPEIVDIANPAGMRYGGDVGLNRGIGSFGA
jgi:hypothetical protein